MKRPPEPRYFGVLPVPSMWCVDRLSRFYSRVQIALLGVRWRAHVHPDVKRDHPYLYVQNHTNHFDSIMLYSRSAYGL